MATISSFLTRNPNLKQPPSDLDLHDHILSRTIPTFFPSHEAHFPAAKTTKPRGVFLLHRAVESSSGNLGQESSLLPDDEEDEEDGLCPVDCVKEFNTEEEFARVLEKAKGTKSLVVVDFYRTSCGSCKYIEQGFAKLCKGAGDGMDSVIFLKHNVLDEYDERSEVAERLRIKSVPLFQFYKDGVLLEAFPTRDKERILATIQKYSSADSV